MFSIKSGTPKTLALGPPVSFEHSLHVLGRDMVVMPEAAPEILRNVHHFVDDRFGLLIVAEAVETFGNELQNIEGFDPHGDLQDFAHPVTAGDDPSRRGAMASEANNLLQIDMMEAQGPNDIGEADLNIVRDFVSDVL
jgi:hypothetical protein